MTWLPLSQLDETEHSWRIQGNTVQFGGKPLKDSDPQTWREAAGEAGKHSFSHDAKHVYYCEHKLPRADAAT